MTDPTATPQARLSQLKHAFDVTFTEALPQRAEESMDLLAIELAGHPYALWVRELRGLYVDRSVTAVPNAPVELRGLAAVRGELVAVYDLAALLGYARRDAPGFLALSTAPALGFAFGALDGHVRVAKSMISPSDDGRAPWSTKVMRASEQTRPIIELALLVTSIEQRLRFATQQEND